MCIALRLVANQRVGLRDTKKYYNKLTTERVINVLFSDVIDQDKLIHVRSSLLLFTLGNRPSALCLFPCYHCLYKEVSAFFMVCHASDTFSFIMM